MIKTSKIACEIVADIIRRDEVGQEKYGTSMDRTDLTVPDWLQHQYEELLDAAQYNRAAFREVKRQEELMTIFMGGISKIINRLEAKELLWADDVERDLKELVFNQRILVVRQANQG